MVQETATPYKTALPEDLADPLPESTTPSLTRRQTRPILSRLSSLFAGVKDKPSAPQTSILDEYVLHSEGVDHYVTSQGFGVRPGQYLWRGEAGRDLDRTLSRDDEEYLDEYKLDHTHEHGILRTVSSLRMNRSVRLPSELQDAHPTSATLAPVLARISHRIAVNVIYSVLGQNALGKPVLEGVEGAMRQVTLVFEVGLMPCIAVPSTIRPPAYDDDFTEIIAPAVTPRRLFRRVSMDTVFEKRTPSREAHRDAHKSASDRITSIHHSRAFRASNGLVVTGNRVFYSEQEVEEAVSRHKREKGACACVL